MTLKAKLLLLLASKFQCLVSGENGLAWLVCVCASDKGNPTLTYYVLRSGGGVFYWCDAMGVMATRGKTAVSVVFNVKERGGLV